MHICTCPPTTAVVVVVQIQSRNCSHAGNILVEILRVLLRDSFDFRWVAEIDPSPAHVIIIMDARRDDVTWFGPSYCWTTTMTVTTTRRHRYSLVYGEMPRYLSRRLLFRRRVSTRDWTICERPLPSFLPRLPAGPCGGCALNIRDFTSSFSNPASVLPPSHVS